MTAVTGLHSSAELSPDALGSAVREAVEFTDAGGWGQPAQLFALVSTALLRDTQPEWTDSLDESELTVIEQEPLPVSPESGLAELEHVLGTTAWPEAVAGCALVQEILVLPPTAESALDDALAPVLADPDAADAAGRAAARSHPDARRARLAIGALRNGHTLAVMQLQPTDDDGDDEIELLQHRDLAPNLVAALAATLDNPANDD